MVVDSHQETADGEVHAHVGSAKTYWVIFGALICLTLLTSGVSYIHLGELNLIVAIAIATAKASLVVLFFMHMKDETKFNALVFLAALLFMGVFLAYTTNDTEHRGLVDPDSGGKIDPRTGEWAYGTPPGLVAQSKEMRDRAEATAMKALQPTAGQSNTTGEPAPEPGVPVEKVGPENVAPTPEMGTAAQLQKQEGRIEPEQVPAVAAGKDVEPEGPAADAPQGQKKPAPEGTAKPAPAGEAQAP